jgi:hypothetical protein
MEYGHGLLSAEILIGAACLSMVFAFTFIYVLVKEVARASRDSQGDQYELFIYLRKTESMFGEYRAQQRSEGKQPAGNPVAAQPG